MTIPRMVVLLSALALVGLAVVALRVEQSIITRRIQVLQFHQSELKQKMWTQEMELAELSTPEKIRERAEQFGVPVAWADDGSSNR